MQIFGLAWPGQVWDAMDWAGLVSGLAWAWVSGLVADYQRLIYYDPLEFYVQKDNIFKILTPC